MIDELVDLTVVEPGTPAIVRSVRSAVHDSVTVTVPPGRKSASTWTDVPVHDTPPSDSDAAAADFARCWACAADVANDAARAAAADACSTSWRLYAYRPNATTTNNNTMITAATITRLSEFEPRSESRSAAAGTALIRLSRNPQVRFGAWRQLDQRI